LTHSPATCSSFGRNVLTGLKILVWDGSGLVLLSKRLERGRFMWPPVQDGAVKLSAAQLTLLFSGVDWSQVVPRTALLTHQTAG
jgi:transposase